MSDTTMLLIGGIITILASGGFATIVVRLLERQKVAAETDHTNAQATDVLVQAGEKAVKILEGQLDRALARIEALERGLLVRDSRIEELEDEVSDLKAHVARLESDS